MDLVLDASVMRRWYFNDEGQAADELIRSLADRQAFVPAHWQAGLLEAVYEVVLAGQLAREGSTSNVMGCGSKRHFGSTSL